MRWWGEKPCCVFIVCLDDLPTRELGKAPKGGYNIYVHENLAKLPKGEIHVHA